VGLNERELEIMQVSIPKQHYYVVSKLGRRLVDLGVGKVALSWVGVNGREERQIVETVMERFPDTMARGMAPPQKPAWMGRLLLHAGRACRPERGGIRMRKSLIALILISLVLFRRPRPCGSRRVCD
jgi:hypothetical protein